MIPFIQKYQRGITLAISVCVVSTFVFFGTSRAFLPEEALGQNDLVYDHGSVKLTRQQMRFRSAFLGSEISETQDRHGLWMALLNPGFLSQLILQTGLGEQLLLSDQPSVDWLKDRWTRESQWSGYRHPSMGQLSFNTLLKQVNPGLQTAIAHWQSSQPAALAADKIALWLQCQQTPFHVLRMLVRYQEQASQAPQDPQLDNRSMQAFGYQNLQDWFGPRFIYLCVELISEGAEQARAMGYEMDDLQAQSLLDERVHQLWKSYTQSQPDVALEQFRTQLYQNMGVDATQLLDFWRDLALFERLCYHESGRLLTDTVVSEQVAQFLSGRVEVEMLEMPKEYQLSNWRDLCQLQLYWQILCGQDLNDASVPTSTRSLLELKRVAPELIAKCATLNVRHLTLEQIRASLGIKRLITLQSQDPLWNRLLESSSKLKAAAEGKSPLVSPGRLELLVSLTGTDRDEIDRATLSWLVENHPEQICELLEVQKPEQKSYQFPLAALRQPLEGIVNAREFFEQLQKKSALNPYSQDGEHFYCIELLSEVEDHCLTLGEANASGIMDGLLTRRLQQHYDNLKAIQSPTISKDGKVRPFLVAQEAVALDLFQKLLLNLQGQAFEAASVAKISKIDKASQANQLTSWRYFALLNQEKALLESGKTPSPLPWSLVPQSVTLDREHVLHTQLEGVFQLAPQQWLPRVVNQKPVDRLVRCLNHASVPTDSLTIGEQLHTLIGNSVDRQALRNWLESLKLDHSLSFLEEDRS